MPADTPVVPRPGSRPSPWRYQPGIGALDRGIGEAEGDSMRIGVLGPLTVDGATGGVGPRDRVVLAALTTCRGETVSTEQLADALWGDDPPPSWAKVVQGCVARLRKRIGPDAIDTVGDGYRLRVSAGEVDAAQFEQSVARAQELLLLQEPDRAAYVSNEALALWRGRPLTEVEAWAPGRIEAERLSELRRDAEELRLEALLRAGRWRDVLTDAQAGVAEAPLRERRWALLTLAQYQAGRQGEALATLRRARSTLVDGLGIDPGPQLLALEEQVLRQDARLDAVTPREAAAMVCPWPGLVAYQEGDSDGFFGRRADVAACLDRLHTVGVVVIIGPSGGGKSSLVRAGIAAALRRDGRPVTVLTPGTHPMDALTALPRHGEAPVLVIDQFEEAVTVCTDAEERTRFFAALVSHAETAPLVVAIRADRLGDLAAYPDIAGLVQRGPYLLTRMTEADLRAAIEGPARQAGLLLEPGLVDLLIRDVEGEPGALPLLSHAMRQTWLARESRTLTVDGYRTSGGIRGAVAQTAEQLYQQAGEEQRVVMRDLLLRLVVSSPDGEPVRTRVPRRHVATDAAHEQVVELLVAARLVTSDEDAVELAHEALIRAWPRLRAWLDDDVEGQRILRHLATTADAWDAMGRPDSELYRGARSTRALDWRRQATPDLTPTEQAFLDASESRAHAEEMAARRRRRMLVGILAGATAVATLLGASAAVQARRATSERDRAIAAELVAGEEAERAEVNGRIARSRELAASAIALLDDDPELSLLLALEAMQGADPPLQAVRALREAVRDHLVLDTLTLEDAGLAPGTYGPVFRAALSPDGRLLALGGGAVGFVRGMAVWDLERGERLWSTGELPLTVGPPRFSVDGAHVVAPVYRNREDDGAAGALDPEGIYVWDAAGGDLEVLEPPVACPVTMVANQPYVDLAGPLVLVSEGSSSGCPADSAQNATDDGVGEGPKPTVLSVFDPTADELRELWNEPFWDTATTSADGRFVAIGAQEAHVLDVETGETLLTVPLQNSLVALDADGGRLVTSNVGVPTELWDVPTGELVRILTEHPDLRGNELAWFSPDGSIIGSATWAGEVRLSEADTGAPVLDLAGHKGPILSVSTSTDGSSLATAAADGTARVWSLTPRGEVATIDVGEGPYWSDAVRLDGGVAAVSGPDPEFPRSNDTGSYTLVDVDRWEPVAAIGSATGQQGALSPDGQRFAVQHAVEPGRYGPVRIHASESGAPLVTMQGMCEHTDPDGGPDCAIAPDLPVDEWVWQLRFSPDGSRLAMTGSWRTMLLVWDSATGEVVHAAGPLSDDGWVVPLAFGPDGAWLALMTETELIVLDTTSWSERTRKAHGLGGLRLLHASPDGRYLVTASQNATLAVYDTTTWEPAVEPWQGHEATILDLEIAPDGATFVSASDDGSIRQWEVDSGRLLQTISMSGPARNVAFLDDHHLLATGAQGPMVVLTLELDELLATARDRLTRGFSDEECSVYALDPCPTLRDLRGATAPTAGR
jgi:WD40 repeat protein/DNA-binding SARP family transcriptional activator